MGVDGETEMEVRGGGSRYGWWHSDGVPTTRSLKHCCVRSCRSVLRICVGGGSGPSPSAMIVFFLHKWMVNIGQLHSQPF